jgi:hypothetical protein
MKKRLVAKPFEHNSLFDAVDHPAGLSAGWIETEVHQDDKGIEGKEQTSLRLREVWTKAEQLWSTPVA